MRISINDILGVISSLLFIKKNIESPTKPVEVESPKPTLDMIEQTKLEIIKWAIRAWYREQIETMEMLYRIYWFYVVLTILTVLFLRWLVKRLWNGRPSLAENKATTENSLIVKIFNSIGPGYWWRAKKSSTGNENSIHPVSKTPEVYDGKTKVSTWVRKMERYLKYTDKKDWPGTAMTFISDEMLSKLDNIDELENNEHDGFEQLKIQLIEKFEKIPPKDKVNIKTINARKQKQGESVSEFGENLILMFEKAFPKAKMETLESQIAEVFANGLSDSKLQETVRYKYSQIQSGEKTGDIHYLINYAKRKMDSYNQKRSQTCDEDENTNNQLLAIAQDTNNNQPTTQNTQAAETKYVQFQDARQGYASPNEYENFYADGYYDNNGFFHYKTDFHTDNNNGYYNNNNGQYRKNYGNKSYSKSNFNNKNSSNNKPFKTADTKHPNANSTGTKTDSSSSGRPSDSSGQVKKQ
jgi:hypothetical protein